MQRRPIAILAGALLCGSACFAISMASTPSRSRLTLEVVRDHRHPTDFLQTLGLPGNWLLGSGFSEGQLQAAAARLTEQRDQATAFVSLRQQLAQLERTRDQLAVDLEENEQRIAAVDLAIPPLRAQVEQARAALQTIVLADATNEQRSALWRIARGSALHLPLDLAVAADDDRTAVRLATAYRAESRSLRTGEQISDESRQLLSTVRARADVLAASGVDARWPQVRGSIDGAVEGEQR